MKIQRILEEQLVRIKPSVDERIKLEKRTKDLCDKISKEIKRKKIKADIFVGGSLAKQTIIKKKQYDIDIFVRFDKKYKGEISEILGKVLGKLKARKIHGSRDYYQIKSGELIFEVVPVIKISSPKEMRNVTDLSYFHVSYTKGQIRKKKKLADEIMTAKSFCHAHNFYGAESYIRGFSGYALELLVIYYGGFVNFLKKIIQEKIPIVLDPAKFYKNKQDVMLNLNEAKLSSPIVFVDPTFKERNALAALSPETFDRFVNVSKKFLRNPNRKYFEKQKVDIDVLKKDAKKKKAEFLQIKANTSKQAGDIAGSKLLKFFRFFTRELGKNFQILRKDFVYEERKSADLYFTLKKRKEIILKGPPINAVENVSKFKKRHRKVFIRGGIVCAKEKVKSFKEFLSDFKKKNKKRMKEMSITEIIF